jgi:arabinose-5-phosphate isomerase
MNKPISSFLEAISAEFSAFKSLYMKVCDSEAQGPILKAIKILSEVEGKVIICGLGKSGRVGEILAASFSSAGTPSQFLHAGEALHGDLGCVKPEDVVLALSKSGHTAELVKVVEILKEKGLPVIALCDDKNSVLGKLSDVVLELGQYEEADTLNLVPTVSVVLSLAVGHALLSSLMACSNFTESDFAKHHPAGSLGNKLLSKVDTKMKQVIPVQKEALISEVAMSISEQMLGIVLVSEGSKIIGCITDGDLRRAVGKAKNKKAFWTSTKACDIMFRRV